MDASKTKKKGEVSYKVTANAKYEAIGKATTEKLSRRKDVADFKIADSQVGCKALGDGKYLVTFKKKSAKKKTPAKKK